MSPHETHRFRLTADAYPGLLSRLLDLFDKRAIVPAAFRSFCDPAGLVVEIEAVDLPPDAPARLLACFRQTYGVRTADLTDERAADLAAA